MWLEVDWPRQDSPQRVSVSYWIGSCVSKSFSRTPIVRRTEFKDFSMVSKSDVQLQGLRNITEELSALVSEN